MMSSSARTAPPVEWSFPRNGQATGRMSLVEGFKTEDSFRFTVRATDTDGFENRTPLEYQITVHEDAKPMVVIDEPRQSEDRTPNATVPLRLSADDDYGFDSVDLVVEGKGPALANRAPLGGLQLRHSAKCIGAGGRCEGRNLPVVQDR